MNVQLTTELLTTLGTQVLTVTVLLLNLIALYPDSLWDLTTLVSALSISAKQGRVCRISANDHYKVNLNMILLNPVNKIYSNTVKGIKLPPCTIASVFSVHNKPYTGEEECTSNYHRLSKKR
jgi:hypothetical protein